MALSGQRAVDPPEGDRQRQHKGEYYLTGTVERSPMGAGSSQSSVWKEEEFLGVNGQVQLIPASA